MNGQKNKGLLLLSSGVMLALSGAVHAEGGTAEKGMGQFNIECLLSHTLPDDPMMAFGRPGSPWCTISLVTRRPMPIAR